MTKAATAYKSPLHQMTQTTRTCLWNDSASLQELAYSLGHGAVGATCNPVIVVEVLKKEIHVWRDRIQQLIARCEAALTEHEIAWTIVEEMSTKARAARSRSSTRTAARTAACRCRPIPDSTVMPRRSSGRRCGLPGSRRTSS